MVNQATLNLTKGFESCVLHAYDDRQPQANISDPRVIVLGTVTIGYGHTGGEVKRDSVITQQQADDYLIADLVKAEARLQWLLKIKVNDNQYGALVDFVYNCGGRYFSRLKHTFIPYRLWLLVNVMADEELIRHQWLKTATTSQGIEESGLVRRRQAEADLFFTKI